MVNKKINKREARLRQLQQKLKSVGPVMRESVVYLGKDQKKYYFSVTMNKKIQLIYLGKTRMKVARRYSKNYKKNYKKLLDIVDEMTIIYINLMKEKILFEAYFGSKSYKNF